jgi:hypothetical protein
LIKFEIDPSIDVRLFDVEKLIFAVVLLTTVHNETLIYVTMQVGVVVVLKLTPEGNIMIR